MAQNEGKPQKPEERFFAELKARVVHAYYTSEIGIKQEMEYKGNSYLPEFAGTDVSWNWLCSGVGARGSGAR